MYKLLVVDDETSIIEGLCSFDWNAMGIELSGTSKNGLSALQWLEKNPVDIVLSDIKMPIMDGLELSKRISQLYPFINVVILSGYDDFELVRGSMKNGVFDYLLKPVQSEELFEVFKKVVVNIEQSKQQQLKTKMLEKKARFATKYLRGEFLKQLLAVPLSEEEIEEGCAYGELALDSELYTVCIVRLDIPAASMDVQRSRDWDLILFAFDNILNELCELYDLGCFRVDPSTGECHIILTNYEIQMDKDKLQNTISTIVEGIYKIDGLIRSTVSCGIGTPCGNIRDIPISAQEAEIALNEKKSNNAIVLYDDSMGKKPKLAAVHGVSAVQALTDIDYSVDVSSKKHILNKAVQFINENYRKSITLNDVAAHVYTNHIYLSEIFKEVTGVNFIHYITNLRIEEAKRLLRDPRYKVSEVGECVGYENPRYFSKIFKKYSSLTPFEYRCDFKGEA